MKMIRSLDVYIGYDEREAIAYHVACQSIIENTSSPLINIIPLRTDQLRESGIYDRPDDDKASNAFSYTRFLVPYLSGFIGTSIYMDTDVIVQGDINELFKMTHGEILTPIWVAQHDYTPKLETKYFGAKQYSYPKKNWSSVMVFKNSACHILTPDYVNKAKPSDLHQMKWLNTRDNGIRSIGELPLEWNWLVEEYPPNEKAELLHYTNGIPAIDGFDKTDHTNIWWDYHARMQRVKK